MIHIEEQREFYNLYFKEFHRLAVGEYAHLSYGNDQPNDTAGSLESIVAYANYIFRSYKSGYHQILNAGAGASSWGLRAIFEAHLGEVTSIDPHREYLHFVEMVCGKNLQYQDFIVGFRFDEQYFDHVYYDYGDIERLPYLGAAIDLASKSLYIDDMQDAAYFEIVKKLCDKQKLKIIECPESLDEHGRFGIIIEK
jgi:hypothetical protein